MPITALPRPGALQMLWIMGVIVQNFLRAPSAEGRAQCTNDFTTLDILLGIFLLLAIQLKHISSSRPMKVDLRIVFLCWVSALWCLLVLWFACEIAVLCFNEFFMYDLGNLQGEERVINTISNKISSVCGKGVMTHKPGTLPYVVKDSNEAEVKAVPSGRVPYSGLSWAEDTVTNFWLRGWVSWRTSISPDNKTKEMLGVA